MSGSTTAPSPGGPPNGRAIPAGKTLRLEREINRRAGFTAADDELPRFFYEEPPPPTAHVARFHADVHSMYDRLPA